MSDDQTTDKGEQLFFGLSAEAEPVAIALLEFIRDMKPMPAPIVTAMACRYVGLFAARVLLRGATDTSAQTVVVTAFESVDARISVSEMLAGNVVIDDGVIDDILHGRPRGPLSGIAEDPTLFDMDAWEEKKKP